MPVLVGARPSRGLRSIAAPLVAIVLGSGLVVAGLVLGVALFAGGFVDRFSAPRPSAIQVVLGITAWTLALVAPALFVVLGGTRLVGALDDLVGPKPAKRPATRVAGRLSDEHVVAARVLLPDGRLVPELVVGPFGVAVVEEVPPLRATRQRGGHWEIRTERGGWAPIEHPLDRATRDAERVRRWLAHEDHDHVVRVYAAVVAPAGVLVRTPECAVVLPDQLAGWISTLPPQRTLNADRRAHIVALVEAAIG